MEEYKIKILKEKYYNPSTGLSGIKSLHDQVKPNIALAGVKEFIKNQESYQIHQKPTKVIKYYPIIGGVGWFQCDLTFFSQYKKSNSGYHIILTCININSRQAYAQPLKTKTADEVVEAFKKIIKDAGIMKMVGFDGGSEFKTKFKNLLKSHGIDYYVSDPGNHTKMAMIERWNQTIRGKIEKYLTAYNTNRWVDVLEKLVDNYNNTIHGTTGYKPSKVKEKEFHEIQNQKYKQAMETRASKQNLKIGDKVRLKMIKGILEKKTERIIIREFIQSAKLTHLVIKLQMKTETN
jgi:hypothetical protein